MSVRVLFIASLYYFEMEINTSIFTYKMVKIVVTSVRKSYKKCLNTYACLNLYNIMFTKFVNIVCKIPANPITFRPTGSRKSVERGF